MRQLLILILLAVPTPGLAGAQTKTGQATSPEVRNVRYTAPTLVLASDHNWEPQQPESND